MVSRWANDEDDAAIEAQRKKEKEEKKRAKAEKLRNQEEADRQRQQHAAEDADDRPSKRRRLSPTQEADQPRQLVRFHAPSWQPARTIDSFERLNHIEEGSYGFVSRAKELATGEIVAIKKMKMDPGSAQNGFPVTALREIQTLSAAKHRHIVDLREVVVGEKGNVDDIFLVMDFLEHDLKTLMDDMEEPFLPSEVKTLMLQLGSAIEFLHDRWILHRDLKTSNILMNNRGEIKIADFGMARFCGDPPPKNLTQLVVTLWYRAPELLLGTTTYDSSVDMWSFGCIFGELLTNVPLLQGKNEVDELSKIFELCGVPTDASWPGFKRLPNARTLRLPRNAQTTGSVIRSKFPFLTKAGTDLLSALLSLNPANRPSAKELLDHSYFAEDPRPKSTAMFPTFPSKAGQERRRKHRTPNAPMRGEHGAGAADFSGLFAGRDDEEIGGGFQLKLV
ncbi:serine/threonine protein kinase, CMGC family, CDC2/CDK subfamily [Aureobasidium pullulans]|uniref:cyclin-dependent kinase n=1 Tax=Aureobasidium pullulans TaxID=5580 RepID=A0A4S8S460_AURPU|nr:serine/threonine protein kinase, CMGC family, CDC2/CDK subfamily [Aureobasidium pullulans]THW36634.1 serine/threonine protein kinase, CMGC family, CDC2/CDK subfamily [Aureobasidium pullulans]THX68278.1 serine/threonine protein kinase, CMGC family, CDC2/CDK subfamily [Aureobasidium pullulans]